MNFVGKFDAKLPADGSVAHSYVHVEQPSTHAPSDAIIVPDAHLLFGADFKRSGVDLILSNADRELVVHDYFKGEHRHPLASPDGAHLTGDIVNALTGQVEVAQADGAAAVAHVIGHVTKLTGSATAIRNGVSIILNQGENVEKGDVVATGSDSTLGVTFIDGTVFGLSSNARMVLNEMVYDPNGSNNSSLISLVAGTISFVAGETAKHGDMKVDTPVATMGIRGTAVLVEIDFNVPGQNGLPDAKFQVLVEPDGTTGSYILFDKTTLDPIATVNKAGQQVNINQNGISYTQSPLTPELQKLITDVFTQKFSNTDTNTKTVLDHFTDSIVPLPFQGFKGPDNIIVQAVFLQTNTLGNSGPSNSGPTTSNPHIDQAPIAVTTSGAFIELTGLTGSTTIDGASGIINYVDINAGDQPTATTTFKSFSYQSAHQQDLSHNLTPTEQAAILAVEVALNVVQDPANKNNGTATWSYTVPDGSFDFLGANETLTLTYLAHVSNNYAPNIEITTVPITITITGTNDVPVITSAVPQTIAFLGGTNVAGGDLTAHVPTSGTITFDDPDLTDTHTVSVSNPTSTLTDPTTNTTTAFTLPPTPLAIFDSALTASITDGTTHLPTDSTGTGLGSVSWSLADLPVWLGDFIPDGEILTLTYVITVTDSQGATATQDVTVTITGTASPAVVWIATTGTGPAPDGLWGTGANWETGNAPTSSDDAIIITDQLEGLTPTYPVTITSAVGVNGAAANSVTMDNFGGAAPVLINQVALAIGNDFDINDHSTGNPPGYTGPEFDNQGTGTVTIGGAFNLGDDSILHNAGSITVDGKMEALGQSTVQNSGTIKLAGGGDFGGQSTISNTASGAIIEVSGGTLNVGVGISNLGTVKVDPTAALTLTSATIDGTVTNSGTLTLNGAAVLKNGTLGNSSQINASGTGNALDNEQVTNTGGIEVVALGALTLDLLTTVTNTGHTITVDGTEDGTGTLTLQGGASITSGNLSNSGTVDIEGTGATLDGVTVTGSGAFNVDDPIALTTLVLKDTTSIADGTLKVGSTGILSDAGSVTLDHVGVTNQNSIEITAGNALTLDDGTSVDNTTGTVTIDGTGKLTLNDASINGGTINDFTTGAGNTIIAGTIDVTGSSTISNAHLNNGNVTLSSGVTLTLTGDTVAGTNFTDTASGATIQIVGNTILDDVTISGGTVTNSFNNIGTTITIDGGQTLTLQDGVTVSGGSLSNSGILDIESSAGVTLNGVTITGGGAIQVDGLTPVAITPLVLEGGTKITGGTLAVNLTSGALAIEGAGGATLDDVGLTNDRSIEVFADSTLVLDDGTTVANGSGTLTIDGTGKLTLNDATITGGTINDFNTSGNGTIDVTGLSTIDGNATLNSGNVTVENATLKLDNVTVNGTTITEEVSGSVIQIDGTDKLTLEGGATIQGASAVQGAISNAGTIEVAGAATLLDATLTNTGIIQVDGGKTLTLSGTEITGGTINNFSSSTGGTIDVTGPSTIDGNATLNSGNVTVENAKLTLDNVTVNGSTITEEISGSVIQIDGADRLTLEGGATIQGTSSLVKGAITNAGTIEVAGAATLLDDTLTNTSIIQVDDGKTLTLSGTEIIGGTINIKSPSGTGGTIDITGPSTIDGNATLNSGNVTIESTKLTLDNVTVNGSTITEEISGSVIQIDGTDRLTLEGSATIQGTSAVQGAISNAGTIEVAGAATLLDDTLTNTGIIQVDDGKTLTLSGTEIIGGTINDFNTSGNGTIDVTGPSTIDGNATLNSGNVTVENAKLTLDNVTVNGSTITEEVSGSVIQIGGTDKLTLEGGATIQGTSALQGTIDNAGTIEIAGAATLLDATVTNTGIIQVDGGKTLTLSGTEITGGTINDFNTSGNGTIDVTSASTINGNATLNSGNVTIENAKLTLDNVMVNGTTITEEVSGSVIQIDGTDKLTLEGGATVQGTSSVQGAISNAGTIEIAGAATLLDDTVTNTGIIQVDGGKTLTLSGTEITGGTINDFNTSGNGTIDVTSASTINGNATLNSGNVTIENAKLTLDNVMVNGTTITEEVSGSVIQIDGTDKLTLEGGATVQGTSSVQGAISNAGTIEIAGAATLLDDTLTNTGIIQVDGSKTLTLSGTEITGGTINDFNTSGNGTIDVTGPSTINGNATLNTGNVKVETATLKLDNVTVNGTTITEEISGSVIQIDGTDKLTLEGGATIQGTSALQGAISNAGTIEIAGAATLLDATVTNTGIIQVDGGKTLTLSGTEISGGTINDFNTSGNGTIDVTGPSTIDGNATLNSGNVTVENAKLTLDNVTVNGTTITEEISGSVIQIDGTDKLTLEGGATIQGTSALQGAISNAGTIEVAGAATLLDATLTNTGIIQVDGAATLTLSGTEISGGTINDFNTSGNGTIDVTGPSTIDGNATLNSGNVTVENATLTLDNVTVNGTTITEEVSGSVIQIDGTDKLTLEGGATIQGTSALQGTIDSAGTIEVAGAATLLDVMLTNTASGNIIQVDGDATLTLNGVNIQGGAIDAMDAGSLVQLENTTIAGATLGTGDLTDGNSGLFQVEASSGANASVLDGSVSAVSVAGYVQVEAGANLELIGTIHNSGTIDIDPAQVGPASSLEIHGTVTLDGGGTVTLDGPSDQIVAASGGGTLNNYETISGNGSIGHAGDGTLTLHNESGGHIEATDGTLTIHTGAAFANDGTIEAGSGGTLVIDDVVTGTGSATIDGGTLEIGAGATDAQTITFTGTGTLQLDDLTSFTGEIVGLAIGDIIDFAGMALPQGIATAIWNGSSLAINGTTVGFTIDGLPDGDTLAFKSDGHGGYDLAVLKQIETAGSSGSHGLEGTAIALNFTDALIDGSPDGAALTSFAISGIPDGATVADANGDPLTVSADGVVTLTQAELINGVPAGLTITPDSDTNLHLSAIATATDGNSYTYTVATPDALVTIDPQAPTVTWAGNTADTLAVTEGTFALHLLADATNGLPADTGNTIQSIMLTGLADGDTITDGTPGDTVVSTGVDDQINITHWNLASPLSVTTVNDANLTLTATVTEQDGDNPAQTNTAQATEVVTVAPQAPDVTWAGSSADTLTVTEGQTAALHVLADGPNGLPADSGNTIQSVFLSGLAQGDTITDGTVAHTVTSSGTSEAIDVSQWTLTTLSVTTANDASFTLTATVTEQDGDNPAQTSTAQAIETVTVTPAAPVLSGDTAATVEQGGTVTLGAIDRAAFADDVLGNVTITGLGDDFSHFSGGTYDVDTGTWTGTATQFNALSFEPGAPGVSSLSISATTIGNDLPTTESYTLTVNAPPTVGFTPDTPVSAAENHATTIDGITVSDPDVGNSLIEVTLAAGNGSLSLTDLTGLDHVVTDAGSVELFGTTAAIDTALGAGVIYTPANDFSGIDTLTVTANDQVSANLGGPLTASEQITVNVEPGTPDFTAMTLTIAQGATKELSDTNFNISDPDTSHFDYSVSNVAGGQFEVSDGSTWTAATSFTTAQVEASRVEFVQDGTDTAPIFSIGAADGVNHSAAIAPTVNFTPTPPVAHDDVLSGPSGSGWVLDTDNGHYYREVTTLGSFEAAVAGAAADGGYLATITSAAEQSFVVNHVIDGFSATWLGGETNNDRPDGSTVNESIWSWVTGPEAGTQFSYTNWNTGEPSGGFNATTQWLQIGPTGGWNDAPDAGQSGDNAGAGYLEEWGGVPTQITFLENTGTAIATSVLLANDTDVNGLTLTVTAVGDSNGHSEHGGTVSLNGNVITYTPSTDYSGADSFTYTISGGSQTSTATVSFDVALGTPVPAPALTITVLTADGLNFKTDSPLSQMGSGIIQPGDDSSFTILDSTDGHKFVLDGSGFSYDGDTVTAGTISAIHELTSEGNTAIADFTGLSVSATAWIAAVQQAAAGDTSAVNSLVANYTVDFVGGSGPDQIGSAGHSEIYNGGGGDDVLNPGSASGGQHVLTGGAGSDTFVYQQGYGAVTITDFDQGNNPGVFDSSENDKIELNGFSNQPNVQDDGHGNVTADFGNGDVLTFLHITAAELNALDGSEIIGGGGDNNGGNGNGPVLGNADNSITYQGPPVLINPAVTLSDPEATVSSVNVWISSGEQSGDQLTINGSTVGDILNSDGSTISYHFDATLNTGNDEGHGLVLSGTGGTPTTADFEAALQLIQFSSTSGDPTAGGTDNSRTITWAAYDNIQHSSTVSTTVNLDIVPVLNSMTLTIAQGGVDVLTNADFSVSDPDTTHFLYSVNNVTGGQFEVFNGTNWVSAPTGGFTTAQIEAGQVEFVQDGTAAIPNFSMTASDGSNVSAPIAPTVNFTEAPSITLDADTVTLAGTSSFGGSGEHQGAAVTFADGHLYLSYNNGPEIGDTTDTADVVAFDAGSGNPTQTFSYAWGKGDFFGIVADASHIYAVGESNPGYGLTMDNVGGAEAKSILVEFDAGGTAGSDPSPALSNTPNNFFSYEGFEYFNKDIVVEQGGQDHVYAVGFGQPGNSNAYIIAEYDSSGHLVAAATDSSVGVLFSDANGEPFPGSSGANDAVAFGGISSASNIWALGYTAWPTDNGGATNQQAVVWEYDASLDLIGRFKDTDAALSGQNASFNDGAVVGNSLYAVGYAGNSSGGLNYLIADYHSDGSIAWSESFGPAGTDVLTGAVALDGLLFVVGSTTSGGVTEGVLMEIDPTSGSVLSTVTYDPGSYNSFTSIATDGQQLYVAGVSGSGAGQDQAVLLTYSVTGNNFAPDHSNDLIVNGGFETGDFSGWTVSGDSTNGNHAAVASGIDQNLGDASHHGLAEALLGGSGGDLTLSQTVATTADEHYTVDFWLMDDASGNSNNSFGNDFSATWNGVALTTLTTDPGSTYTEYQFDVVGAAGQSTLEFSAQTGTGSWALDDVSVRDGAPTTVQQVTDQAISVAGVHSGDALAVTPVGTNPIGTVTATAGSGTVEWQFAATNAQLDHLIGMTQNFTVADQNNSAVSQTVAVSIGGAGNDQFMFAPGAGADTMVNFTVASNAQGAYVGETIQLDHFSNISGVNEVLQHLSTDTHGNAVVDLGNHDSITFQGISAATIQANATHIFQILA